MYISVVAVSLKKNFFKQKTAYEIHERLVGSEMCIRDRYDTISSKWNLKPIVCSDAFAKDDLILSLIHI